MNKKLFLVLILCACALSSGRLEAGPEQAAPKVEKAAMITDPLVENAFRAAIKKPSGELTAADLKKEVWRLDLRTAKVTDASLKEVSKLKGLKALLLSHDAEITDHGLRELTGLTELKGLSLMDTRITDAGLAHLTKLKKLENLNLQRTKVTEEGVAKLKKSLPGCKILYWPNKPAHDNP